MIVRSYINSIKTNCDQISGESNSVGTNVQCTFQILQAIMVWLIILKADGLIPDQLYM